MFSVEGFPPSYTPPAWKGICWVCGVPSSSLLIKVGTAENGREMHSTCIGLYIESTRPPQNGRLLTNPAPISSPEQQAAEADWLSNLFSKGAGLRPDELPLGEPMDMNFEGPSLEESETEPPKPKDIKKRKMLLDD